MNNDGNAISDRALLIATMEMLNALSIELLGKQMIVSMKTDAGVSREILFYKSKVQFKGVQ